MAGNDASRPAHLDGRNNGSPPPNNIDEINAHAEAGVGSDGAASESSAAEAAGGYTPLDGNGSFFFAYGAALTSTESDDEDCGDDDDSERKKKMLHIMGNGFNGDLGGAFFADMSVFGVAGRERCNILNLRSPSAEDENNDADKPDIGKISQAAYGVGQKAPTGKEEDFRAIADRALRMLDDEYASTVKSGDAAAPNEVRAIRRVACADESLAVSDLDSFDARFENDRSERKENKLCVRQAAAEEVQRGMGGLCSSTGSDAQPHFQTGPEQRKKEISPVDADAVRKAVQAIRIKAPDLSATLDKWKPTRNDTVLGSASAAVGQVFPKHPIIPKAPLLAFRRTSPKAVDATANLTRSATLAEAIRRVPTALCKSKTSTGTSSRDTLVVHVVGADHVECKSDASVRSALGPFVRWIGAMRSEYLPTPARIELVLIGPNVTEESSRRPPIDMLPKSSDPLKGACPGVVSATAVCVCGLYHEFLSDDRGGKETNHPNLVVLFNAGIWGYDEWRPTLEAMCLFPVQTLVVVTAYTVEEAEEDAEVIEEVVASSTACSAGKSTSQNQRADSVATGKEEHRKRCLWGAEPNPFGSRKKRDTATAIKGRVYHENGAWQGWALGGT